MKPKVMEGIVFWFILAFFLLSLSPSSPARSQAEEIKVLEKVGEIGEKFGEGEEDYFWHIDDLCCDDEGNLYVTDSGWNKIFKFSPEGKFLGSFGREGQGPGEFLVSPGRGQLNISFGQNGFIYVVDSGNWRLSVFNKKGQFLRQFPWPKFLYDSVSVNSKGDIIIISREGNHIIKCYNSNFRLKTKFLPAKWHFHFPLIKPPGKMFQRYVSDRNLQKELTREGKLVVLSNLALKIFVFNQKFKLENEFEINNKVFLIDFKKRLEKALDRQAFILPFNLAIDEKDNICLNYFNQEKKKREIYRYNLSGKLIDILMPNDEVGSTYIINHQGRYFFEVKNELIRIFK